MIQEALWLYSKCTSRCFRLANHDDCANLQPRPIYSIVRFVSDARQKFRTFQIEKARYAWLSFYILTVFLQFLDQK